MKKTKIIGISLITLFVLTFSWYLFERFSYANEKPYYSLNLYKDSILTVGIIGDSWVAGKKLDSILHEALVEKGFKNKILSSGHPGAKSKLIYQNLFEESNNEHSSKFIIQNCPDYCIVIAGVNDAVGQCGANFYSHNISLIIKTLLHFRIKPIIVELPEFGIIEATNKMGIIERKRNEIYAKFTNSGEIDNIETYRKAFNKEIEIKHLKDSIIQIDFDSICVDYNKFPELYANPSHLSQKGNEKLCHTIAKEFSKIINAP